MAFGACGWLWIDTGVHRSLWRSMDINGCLLVLVDTNG